MVSPKAEVLLTSIAATTAFAAVLQKTGIEVAVGEALEEQITEGETEVEIVFLEAKVGDDARAGVGEMVNEAQDAGGSEVPQVGSEFEGSCAKTIWGWQARLTHSFLG